MPSFERSERYSKNAFQNILNDSNRKPNKIWIDEYSEFYNRPLRSVL